MAAIRSDSGDKGLASSMCAVLMVKYAQDRRCDVRHAKSLVRCPLAIHGVLSLITMTFNSHSNGMEGGAAAGKETKRTTATRREHLRLAEQKPQQ